MKALSGKDDIRQLDRALDILIILITTIASALFQYGVWLRSPTEAEMTIMEKLIRTTLLPVLIIIILWLFTNLTERRTLAICLKLTTWTLSLGFMTLYLGLATTIMWSTSEVAITAMYILLPTISTAVLYFVLNKYEKAMGKISFKITIGSIIFAAMISAGIFWLIFAT